MKETLYETLGIAEMATADDIKAAYRTLAKKHHPDMNNGSAASAALFREIKSAYEILSDPVMRAAYDAGLRLERLAAKVRETEAREAAARAEAERVARVAAAQTAARSPNITGARPASSPQPPASKSGNWGAALLTVLGLGIVAAAASSGGSSARWDRRAGRYRDSVGRFTSG